MHLPIFSRSRLSPQRRVYLTVLVAALGYFVDVFDIQLFAALRFDSLQSLGLSAEENTVAGTLLLNWQMAGMLLGGILWGVLGDKKGRVQVLFGSILLYSIGNIANAFVTSVPAYALVRFLTGVGLAGEVGAGITLASELLPKETRGYATTLVATCGIVGAGAAAMVGDALGWRAAYAVGGLLGLLLLLLRISVSESVLFNTTKEKAGIVRGRFLMFFTDRKRCLRYLSCIAIAVPVWFVVGILVIFAPELGKVLHTDKALKASTAVISYAIGIGFGGVMSGLLSQYFESRKKVLFAFIAGTCITSYIVLFAEGIPASGFYALTTLNGFFIGYWVLFLSTTAEQFGTNLRTTATASASNFVRGSVIITTHILLLLKPYIGFLDSARIVALLCFGVAFLALWRMPETFARDLDFNEK